MLSMIKIRLTKTGSKNERKFRIVAASAPSKRNGKFLEILGYFLPQEEKLKIDLVRYNFWINNGAQPTQAVLKLIETNTTTKNGKG